MNETFGESAPTLKFGTVSAVDEQTMRVRVRLPECDNLRTDWLPVLTRKSLRDKDYWLPDIGEHVAVLLDVNGDDGVVLGAIFSDADVVPVTSRDKRHIQFEDGTWIQYDRQASTLKIHCVGDIHIHSETSIRLTAPRIDYN
ncbi:MAG TPA: phage baseplate assembly protein V [Paucimonas sp.]|nr:phage baseplate assembly protein V [Paucimonas sp.]